MTRSSSIVPKWLVEKHVDLFLNKNGTYCLALTISRSQFEFVCFNRMKVNTKRFREFYERVKGQFPYNEVRVTRTQFHVKWLLMSCKTDPGILFHHGRLYPLLCTTLDSEVVQHLIISEQGLPLPEDFSLLMDCMFCWGRGLSVPWYNKTLELVKFYLLTSDLNRATFSATDLYCDVIQMRVQQLISRHYTHGHHRIYESWLQHYKEMVRSGKKEFFPLAVSSFQYTNLEDK